MERHWSRVVVFLFTALLFAQLIEDSVTRSTPASGRHLLSNGTLGRVKRASCQSHEFQCTVGSCIPKHYVCDNTKDCPFGDDEENCHCDTTMFHCGGGHCIPRRHRCDGEWHCENGSDEVDCPGRVGCPPGDWTCKDLTCIEEYKKCDGRSDCPDHTDEEGCNVTTPPPLVKPTIQLDPQRKKINQGSDADFTCTARGSPPPKIKWSKVNSDSDPVVLSVGNKLRIIRADVSDRGMYLCTAVNSAGTATAAVILEVERREPPTINIYPEVKQTVVAGESPLFQCHIIGGIPNPTLSWTRSDGQPFSPNTVVIDGVLRFNIVQPDAEGAYTCTAENDVDRATATVVLEVHSPPRVSILQGPAPLEVRVGERLVLECVAEGDPTPSVSWQKLGSNSLPYLPTRLTTTNTHVYEKEQASKSDAGTYQCSARNEAGENAGSIAVIVQGCQDEQFECDGGCIDATRVCNGRNDCNDGADEEDCETVAPSRPIAYPRHQEAYVGDPVKIHCTAKGPQPNDFYWIREEGAELPKSAVKNGGELMIHDIEIADAGKYMCIAHYKAGPFVSKPIEVSVYGNCQPNEFQCSNGHCTPNVNLCNGRSDCSDDSDEESCATTTTTASTRRTAPPTTTTASTRRRTAPSTTTTSSTRRTAPPPTTTASTRRTAPTTTTTASTRRTAPTTTTTASTRRTAPPTTTAPEPMSAPLTAPFRVEVTPKRLVVPPGNTVTLTCTATGTKEVGYKWVRGGAQLPPSADVRWGEITIRDIKPSDEGTYICLANNRVETVGDTAVVKVRG